MKKILLLSLFVLGVINSFAQTYGNFRQVRFFPITIAGDTAATVSNDGRMWYDLSTDRFRGIRNGTPFSFGSGSSSGGGTVVSASAGLHLDLSGTDVRLGGALNTDTIISGAGILRFTNTALRVNSGVMQMNNPANTFNYNFVGSDIVANRNATLPLLTADDTFTFNNATQTLNNKTFGVAGYSIMNPAGTFSYNILGGAITNNRTVTYPLTSTNSVFMLLSSSPTATRVPFGATGNIYTEDSGFTFNTTGDILTVGSLTALTTATLPAINLGGGTADPSTLVDGGFWYRTDTDVYRGRANGSTITFSTFTNAAASNELIKSNGTNGTTSGLFSTSLGNLNLGDASTTGNIRTFQAVGSTGNTRLLIRAEGTEEVRTHSDQGLVVADMLDVEIVRFQPIAPNGLELVSNQALILRSRDESTSDVGDVLLSSGDATASTFDAGDITIRPGSIVGGIGAVPGNIIIETRNSTGTIMMNDGANEQMGTATLVGGTVTVNNSKVTANTRIQLTHQAPGGTLGVIHISARVAGTSFTITSSSGTDTSVIFWQLWEPN